MSAYTEKNSVSNVMRQSQLTATSESSQKLRITLVFIFLVVSSFIYLFFLSSALRWRAIPFPGFLLDPNLVVNATTAEDWPAKNLKRPITYPERLISIDGHSVTKPEDVLRELALHPVGTELQFTFVQPTNSRVTPSSSQNERTVMLELIEVSNQLLWRQFGILYLVGLLTLGIGILTFWIRPDNDAAQTFAIFTATAAVAIGGLFNMETTQHLPRVWIAALSLTGSLNAQFAIVFPHRIRLVRQNQMRQWLFLLPGLAIMLWGQFWLNNISDPWAYAVPWRYAYLLNGLALLASLLIMAYRGFNSHSTLVRQQSLIILGSAVAAFVPALLFFIATALPGLLLPQLNPTIIFALVVIYPCAIGYAIIRYRLLKIDIILRRTVPYLLITGLLIVVGPLLALGVTAKFTPFIGMDSLLWAALIFAGITLFLEIPRRKMQDVFRQRMGGRAKAFHQLLRQYSRQLRTAVTLDEVLNTIVDFIAQGTNATEVRLYLPDEQTDAYCVYPTRKHIVNNNSPFVRFMHNKSEVYDLAEENAWPQTFKAHANEIYALDADILIPLNNGHELLGWLTLGARQDGRPYSLRELNYLEALADQSTIGIERAGTIRRLETRVANLDLLSQFSQAVNFTVVLDDLLELIYTNYRRLLDVDEFHIAIKDHDTQDLYRAFYVINRQRNLEHEGINAIIYESQFLNVLETGQTAVTQNDQNQELIIAPLNAGAKTLGIIYTVTQKPNMHLRQRQRQLFSVLADTAATALERIQAQDALKERARQLEAFNEITNSLTSTLDVNQLLEIILDKALELLETEAGSFIVYDQDKDDLEFKVVRGPISDTLLGTRLPMGMGLAGEVAQTGRPLLINNAHADKRWYGRLDKLGNSPDFVSQSILTVPMLHNNTVLGVLQVVNKRSRAPFNEEDQQFLTAFAGQAVIALENARLLAQTDQKLQDRVDELFRLQQLDRALNTTLDLERVLNLTLDWVLRISRGTAGGIVIIDEEKQLRSCMTHGYDPDSAPVQFEPDYIHSGLLGRVLNSAKPHISDNVHTEKNYIQGAEDTHSQLTIPITHQEKLLGAVVIESDQFDAFDKTARDIIIRVVNHAAATIANALLYEQVQEANQAKSAFVSMVSHELKTPMTAMRGYTDLILSGMMGELSTQHQDFMERIQANLKRMGHQIQDLTDISRIETNHLSLVWAPIAYSDIIDDTLTTVQSLCNGKNIGIDFDVPPALPLVMGDQGRLVQVLTNLLSNACKYSPPDTTITVSLSAELQRLRPEKEDEPAVPVVVCAVKDQGYGISEEDLEGLFTKFFRSQDPNIRQSTGTGLGLSITKGIVELHNGRIWVESKLGHGTTFSVAIPQA